VTSQKETDFERIVKDLREENARLNFRLKEIEHNEETKVRELERILSELREENSELTYKIHSKDKRLSGMFHYKCR
jgi:hypothetical protein